MWIGWCCSACQLWQVCCAAFSSERKTITMKENMGSTQRCAAPLNNDPESLSKVVQQCSWKPEILWRAHIYPDTRPKSFASVWFLEDFLGPNFSTWCSCSCFSSSQSKITSENDWETEEKADKINLKKYTYTHTHTYTHIFERDPHMMVLKVSC